MILTNKWNAPDVIYNAVKNDPYDPGDSDYTATGLIAPPRILSLKKKHSAELEEDVKDLYARFFGKIGHLVLEGSGAITDGEIRERRFYSIFSNKKISAQIDHYKDGVITDYKCVETSKYDTIGSMKKDYEEQLNIQAELMRENGYKVKAVRLVYIFRDFYLAQAKQNELYPQTWWAVDNGVLWEPARAKAFIELRLAAHEAAKEVLPECSPEERWDKPSKYAVVKRGAKRAVKLWDKEGEAIAHADELGEKYEVIYRPGMRTRCEWYCNLSSFCNQYKTYKESKHGDEASAE